MGERSAALIAAVITLPLALLLVWLSVRNFIRRVINVRDAVEQARKQRPHD